MGVYIKGLEMPTSCYECPMGDSVRCALMPGVPAWWEEYDQCVKEKRLHSFCPLVPVQEHGRLIDADALMELYADADEMPLGKMKVPIAIIRQNIVDMPTIIPAEEGE